MLFVNCLLCASNESASNWQGFLTEWVKCNLIEADVDFVLVFVFLREKRRREKKQFVGV